MTYTGIVKFTRESASTRERAGGGRAE